MGWACVRGGDSGGWNELRYSRLVDRWVFSDWLSGQPAEVVVSDEGPGAEHRKEPPGKDKVWCLRGVVGGRGVRSLNQNYAEYELPDAEASAARGGGHGA
eukprot:gene39228-12486_t